jgi:VIT1/CCC1 family predicted Fe2+/Mn2+ transporter
VATTAAQLSTIRALSQYRPFEGGGESTLEAHEDIALAALAEAGGSCETVGACQQAIETCFGIRFEELTIGATLNRLIKSSRVRHGIGRFALSNEERERLDQVAKESREIAEEALRDWRSFLEENWPLTSSELAQLERDLGVFLARVLRRHGAEATLLLYPDSDDAQRLYAEIEEAGFDFLERVESELAQIRDFALSQFVRRPTEAQRAYLNQNLNVAYFQTVLSIDPEGAELVAEAARGQRVYLDTNFVYRLLGVQGPRYVKPAEAILRVTQEAGYECCVTPWTLDEFRTSLKRSRDFVEKYPIPPDQYADLAANATSDENFVTAYWRRVRSGLKPGDFFNYYAAVEQHLADRGISVIDEGCTAVQQLTEEINDEISLLENAAHGRYRHPATLEHDVKHRLLVKKLRGQGVKRFSNAGYWFLTHDSVLPRYDHISARGEQTLAFCVSAGVWFQIMEAFRAKTNDPEQSLADMMASPYVRYRRTLSAEAAASIVARVHQYEDGTPELAASVLMDSAATDEIEAATTDEERLEKIDSAILAAAKHAQEEARQSRELAAQERERAETAEHAAKELLRETEAVRKDEAERAKQRREEAVRDEADRARREREEQERRHADELRRRDDEIAATRRERNRAKRRLFMGTAFIISVVAFLLLDLAVGLSTAWSIVVAAAVLFGLWLGVDQLIRRRIESSD